MKFDEAKPNASEGNTVGLCTQVKYCAARFVLCSTGFGSSSPVCCRHFQEFENHCTKVGWTSSRRLEVTPKGGKVLPKRERVRETPHDAPTSSLKLDEAKPNSDDACGKVCSVHVSKSNTEVQTAPVPCIVSLVSTITPLVSCSVPLDSEAHRQIFKLPLCMKHERTTKVGCTIVRRLEMTPKGE
ncbi:hypothetical protein L596_000054 [Steinernema carpocapsae]|uniref:Uncharacterized protein n=1 Tax=Steinernema carpocapsae TaxID=34508 RepID=A0A4U8UHH7_STECR|nr:hypothetical protein L596_000054 [Steinernema carpocapsae]